MNTRRLLIASMLTACVWMLPVQSQAGRSSHFGIGVGINADPFGFSYSSFRHHSSLSFSINPFFPLYGLYYEAPRPVRYVTPAPYYYSAPAYVPAPVYPATYYAPPATTYYYSSRAPSYVYSSAYPGYSYYSGYDSTYYAPSYYASSYPYYDSYYGPSFSLGFNYYNNSRGYDNRRFDDHRYDGRRDDHRFDTRDRNSGNRNDGNRNSPRPANVAPRPQGSTGGSFRQSAAVAPRAQSAGSDGRVAVAWPNHSTNGAMIASNSSVSSPRPQGGQAVRDMQPATPMRAFRPEASGAASQGGMSRSASAGGRFAQGGNN